LRGWGGEGGGGVGGKGGGWGHGGEMSQALYAHMNNKRKKDKSGQGADEVPIIWFLRCVHQVHFPYNMQICELQTTTSTHLIIQHKIVTKEYYISSTHSYSKRWK
jgi:hypothetical protein